ncbi:NADH dehydrogenase [ubiquinone] iron-sulfur protein 6, mitochondrial [Hylaeus volcanicus]|uniref:NADH dehydrogenase [ubiquinone] iron-sulfur protein 6, mitochondrial n=1 Tax=Hylaeus volcanicus TaxID=313075 RepID=UPI0023B88164|nr:NADH dehydrogenase [ubiquinone] iron-sulfur protein 6, mitochondrial [Hylaeus volcanicus]
MASKKVVELFGISSKSCKANFANVIVRNCSNLPSDSTKKVTHTGQVFEEDDYRNVRFTYRPKEVNDNWAIKLIDEVPPAPAKERIVACDGGGGPLGHPKVYINLDKPGNHTCGYCGLRFYKEGH